MIPNTLEVFQFYEENPISFCEEVLGLQLDEWQKEAFHNLIEYHFVAIRSGSGVGKTFWLSLAIVWFLATKPFSKVPTTAPSQHQLYDLLWSELFKHISKSPFLQGLLNWTQTRLGVRGYDATWYAVARTAQVSPSGDVAEGIQGFHCSSYDTDVLTSSGWKNIAQIDIKRDKLLTKDPETDEAFYEHPSAMFKGFYQGEMYHSVHQSLDFLVTPNHKIPYRSKTRKGFSKMKLDEIQNITYSNWRIEDQFKWEGNDAEVFELPPYFSNRGLFPHLSLNAEMWFTFLGIFVAEGHTRKDGLRTMIAQKSVETTLLFIKLITALGFKCTVSAPRDDIYMISIYSIQLGDHLKSFGSLATNKKLPNYVRNASPRLINAFLNGFCLGDGTINKNGARVFYTSSKELAGNLQELIFKLGRKGSVLKYEVSDSIIRGKLVTDCADRYVVTEYIRTGLVSIDPKVNLEKVHYEGDVYCPTMPTHHLFFMRRNGFCMWSGNSEDNLLFVVDESSGVPDSIYPAMEGALTGSNAYAILTGNPTRTSGYFFDIFNNPKLGKMYKKMHVSCLDSPRVEQRYIDMMKERYGENHPIYLIKVLGDFPTGSINTLIPYSHIEAMMMNKKDVSMSPKLSPQMGLDIGRSQASSVLTVRQGFNVLDIAEKHKPGKITDTEEICQWVGEYINAYDPQFVKVDAIFNPGVFDLLKSFWGNKIVPVIGGQRSTQPERFINLRAEGYWDLRELVPKLWCAEWPQRLIAEMSDIRQKENVRKDIIQIESKKDMMNRAMRSPDFADSLMYAFLSPEACLMKDVLRDFTFSHEMVAINDSFLKQDIWSIPKTFQRSKNRWRRLDA